MRRTLRISFAILSLFIMGVIFFFSCQNGSESSDTSGRFTQLVLSLFFKDFRFMNEVEQGSLIVRYGHLIRKLAHFSEFAALGFTFSGFLATFPSLEKRQGMVYAVLFSFFYACSDEFHQMFVALRGPGFKDVLIDTAGSIFGTVLLFMIVFCLEQFRKNH